MGSLKNSLAWIAALPDRSRLATKFVSVAIEARQQLDVPGMQAALEASGTRVEDRTLLATVFGALRQAPRLIREHEHQYRECRRRVNDAEPFLCVARRDAPEPYHWEGPATIIFTGSQLSGRLSVEWDGISLRGKHEYSTPFFSGTISSHETPGRLQGPARRGRVDANGIAIKGISGMFEPLIGGETSATFSALHLRVSEGPAPPSFHRYLFCGGRLRGWTASSERIVPKGKGYTFSRSRDSHDFALFDRRARATAVRDDQSDARDQIIGVTIEGEPLSVEEQDALWHLLSFVVGNRLQPTAIEHFDKSATRTELELLGTVPFGEPAKGPPFDLRIAESGFQFPNLDVIARGFQRLFRAELPLAIALHHLHDANTSYIQVEVKNLLFCIHTLFESWADANGQRNIIPVKQHDRLRKELKPVLDQEFGDDTEIRSGIQDAIRNAYKRVGAVLQERFFDSLGVTLSALDRRALRLRNRLFHSGFIAKKAGVTELDFYQGLNDDAGTLRTLAHYAILKLAGYDGQMFDYRKWSTMSVRYPPKPSTEEPATGGSASTNTADGAEPDGSEIE